jgi:ATP-dependent Clp protease ATP-binding subunit ClpA
MFERFTAKAIQVIMLAQEEARRLGHNFIGTEQILLGLIGEGTGVAAKVLKSMGLNLKDARIEVEKIIGRGSGSVAPEIPLTPHTKRVLELSLEEARQLGLNYIETEHLLLGLTRINEGVAARVLENLGVDLSIVRTRITRTLHDKTVSVDANLSQVAMEVIDVGKAPGANVPRQDVPRQDVITTLLYDRFTKKSLQCLLASSNEAINFSQRKVTLELLFLGLLKENTSIAAKFLHSMEINLENTVNIITERLTYQAFTSDELKLLEVLRASTRRLNSELSKVVIEREKAEIRQDFEMASAFRDRENDIKKQISLLKSRIASETWEIFEHTFVRNVSDINFSDESLNALNLAVKESQRLNHNHVNPEHILLGLIETGGLEFVDFLEELGTHALSLRRRLDNLLAGESYTSKNSNVYIENLVNNGGEIVSEKSININAGRDISGSVINLGEISGNVSNTINQLQESKEANTSELADLLKQLQSSINSEDNGLDDKDKAKALKYIDAIGKLGSKQNDLTLRENADTALDALSAIVGKVSSLFGSAKPLIDSVRAILGF